jgi:hypothetical protein
MDTDSIIWIDDGTIKLETGNQIGEWEDEFKDIKGYDSKIHGITEFVSTGPKTYAFITNIPINKDLFHSCVKSKGFVNSYQNNKTVNMENYIKLIKREINTIKIEEDIFIRNKFGSIKTRNQEKKYSFVDNFNKRRLNKFDETKDYIIAPPFGY